MDDPGHFGHHSAKKGQKFIISVSIKVIHKLYENLKRSFEEIGKKWADFGYF